MHILGIIPARYGSTRLPGKPLIKVRGKTIIQRVYERVKMAKLLNEVVVATDDVRIYNHVKKFGGKAEMTRIDHPSGTYRCAEVARRYAAYDVIVNVQGDEPLINPLQVDQLSEFISSNVQTCPIATLIKKIDRQEDLEDPSVAKVVHGHDGRVLYFSRATIPFVRNHPQAQWLEHHTYYKHIGLYAYTRDTLMALSELERSKVEQAELLEQVNWLYHGFPVFARETDIESIGVDTPDDLDLLNHILGLADR